MYFFVERNEKKQQLMGGLDGCRVGRGRLGLVVLVSEKPYLVSEKSGNFIYLCCWQPW